MSLLGIDLDYSDRDFTSLKRRLQNLLRGPFPAWENFDAANFENILLELFCFVGDRLNFYLDNRARERFFATAVLRESLVAACKLIGYTPRTAVAAQASLTITLGAPPIADFVVPAGSTIRTQAVTDPIVFQLLSGFTIPAGTNPPTVVATAEHSESRSDTFSSSGAPDQSFRLTARPFLDGTELIEDDDGAWTRVDSFLESTAIDRHYVVLVDRNDRATIRTGDGVQGKIPTGTVTADYRTGGGPDGNVEMGALQFWLGTKVDSGANPVSVTVTNAEAAAGGRARESIEEIRQNAPRLFATQDRSVENGDYEAHAEAVPGCARALLLTSDEWEAIDENVGFLYVVPDAGGTASPALLTAVTEMVQVTKPRTVTFQVNVVTALYKTVDVRAVIYLARGASGADVKARMVAALTAFFAPLKSDDSKNDAIDFGYKYQGDDVVDSAIPLSTIFDLFDDDVGIRRVGARLDDFTLNGQHDDVALELRQFPALGTVTIVDGDTGAIL